MTKEEFLKELYTPAWGVLQFYMIRPIITLTQAFHESSKYVMGFWKLSGLTVKANNLFGMKYTPKWKGAIWSGKTIEYPSADNSITYEGKFKAYQNWGESIWDWAELISKFSLYKVAYEYAKKGEVYNYGKEVRAQYDNMGRRTRDGFAWDPVYERKLLECSTVVGKILNKNNLEF